MRTRGATLFGISVQWTNQINTGYQQKPILMHVFQKFPISGHNLIEAETSKIAEKNKVRIFKMADTYLAWFSPYNDWFLVCVWRK